MFSGYTRRFALRSLGVLVALGCVRASTAQVSDIVFNINASNAEGNSSWSVMLEAGTIWNGSWSWQLTEPVELRHPTSGNLIGTLVDADLELIGGGVPRGGTQQVSMGFAVQSGDLATDFTISSALLSFPTINTPEGRASAAFTLTDVDGTGATLTGRSDNGGAYLAHYNGFVPGGTEFAELIATQMTAPAFGSAFLPENHPLIGFLPIGVPVSDMSAQVDFNLTANDFASGTTNYVITPEPAALALLALAAAFIRRR